MLRLTGFDMVVRVDVWVIGEYRAPIWYLLILSHSNSSLVLPSATRPSISRMEHVHAVCPLSTPSYDSFCHWLDAASAVYRLLE